jgi:cellulose synthase/poly-beta-1,6-N-acetylglucosamine synthase-like glycosyltransferase
MKYVFWISLAVVAYSYLGYPLVLWIQAKLRPRPIAKAPLEPTISVVIAAHNEGDKLAAKIENLRQVEYPSEKVEIVISSDGSTDGTNEFLSHADGIRFVVSDLQQGKAAAVNRALELCTGEIVIFTDARQRIEPSAFRKLLRNFSDPSVGSVSGELEFPDASGGSGVSLYWRFEKAIRKLESSSGSVMGVTGAFYATRRSLVAKLPAGLILDDVYSPLKVMEARSRVVFEGEAVAWDKPSFSHSVEFRRKVRTLMGNYELLGYFPWLALPFGATGFRFFSHKLLRLAVPWLLIIAYLSSAALSSITFYLGLLALQTLFYLSGAVAAVTRTNNVLLKIPGTLCLLNAAALVALITFLRRSGDVGSVWQPTSVVTSTEPLSREVRK